MKNGQKALLLATMLFTLPLSFNACSSKNASISLLPDGQNFKQDGSAINNQIDILWVVDNSSSMTPLQNNLVNNFNSFISSFVTKGYDFHIAVTTSDAYLALPNFLNRPEMARYKDGAGSVHTGIFDITNGTPDILNVFVKNAVQGDTTDLSACTGCNDYSGDERVFSSMKAALSSPLNSGFLRPNSFLAVIILSDEDDFSDETRSIGSWKTGGIPDHDYQDPNLDSVDSYVAFLKSLSSTPGVDRKVNVSAITVKDSTCLSAHQADSPNATLGTRYIDMAQKTDGVVGSICDSSYADSLGFIQQRIAELSTQFYLERVPDPASIQVFVSGTQVAQNDVNGWTYMSSSNSIVFHGNATPPQNATIQVKFDPTTLR